MVYGSLSFCCIFLFYEFFNEKKNFQIHEYVIKKVLKLETSGMLIYEVFIFFWICNFIIKLYLIVLEKYCYSFFVRIGEIKILTFYHNDIENN